MNDLVTKEAWKVVKKDLMSSVNHTCKDFVEALGEDPNTMREKHLEMLDTIASISISNTASEIVTRCLEISESFPEFIVIFRNIMKMKAKQQKVLLSPTSMDMDTFVQLLLKLGGKGDEK